MKVTKFVAAGLLVASLLIAPAANAATVVNVDGTANASTNGSNPVVVALGAGTYNLSFTSGLYDAFSRFSGSAGCDSNGQNCSQGFENSIKYAIAPSLEGGEIFVHAGRAEGHLRVDVSDTGSGFEIDGVPEGHGLDNLRGRLVALFGGAADLSVHRAGDRTVVSLKVPA